MSFDRLQDLTHDAGWHLEWNLGPITSIILSRGHKRYLQVSTHGLDHCAELHLRVLETSVPNDEKRLESNGDDPTSTEGP